MKLSLGSIEVPAGVIESAIEKAISSSIEELRLLDAKEAAKLCNLPLTTFRGIAKREGIAYVDFGERRTRWSIASIRALIAKREVKGNWKRFTKTC